MASYPWPMTSANKHSKLTVPVSSGQCASGDILPSTSSENFLLEWPLKVKGKSVPVQPWTGPEGSRRLRLPDFKQSAHEGVRLSALSTGPLYPPGNICSTHFCQRLSQPLGLSETGRIMSMKNSSDTIGNRTRDLPACNAVPQPTAPAGDSLFPLYP